MSNPFKVLDLLLANGGWMTCKQVAYAGGLTVVSIKNVLGRLLRDGCIEAITLPRTCAYGKPPYAYRFVRYPDKAAPVQRPPKPRAEPKPTEVLPADLIGKAMHNRTALERAWQRL